MDYESTIKTRDDDIKKRREMENDKKNRPKGGQNSDTTDAVTKPQDQHNMVHDKKNRKVEKQGKNQGIKKHLN